MNLADSENLFGKNRTKLGLKKVFSPLDQFEIAPFFKLVPFGFDFSFTNLLFVTLLNLCILQCFVWLMKDKKTNSLFVAPSGLQFVVEKLYRLIANLLFDIVTTGSEKYFPTMAFIFMLILTNNLIGLIPYSFTITSHITVTFLMSFSIFISLNIIGFEKHGLNLFSLFLPANTNIVLALILVPIEFVSYMAKPISLGVRLFINLMAGHSLLKVVAWFSWNMLLVENLKALAFLLPIFILIPLMGLEFGVAFIQAYVFLTLVLIYLNDVEVLH